MSGSNSSAPSVSIPVFETEGDPLALTVHSQPLPVSVAAGPQTRAGRLRMLLVMAICAAPVLASYFTFYVVKPHGHAYSDLITPTRDLPADLPLTDLQGQGVRPESLKGQWLLTLVQPGACDSECDRMLFMQRQLREMLGKERDKVDKVWLVPDDQPLSAALMKAVSDAPAVTVLRVPPQRLQAWLQPAPGHRLGEHLFLIDPMGRWMMRTPAHADPMAVKKDLERLLRASASWDQPGR
ncbi:MAG: hypothetical protein JOY60_13965 [Burkholderiaceae bacterium]|nr:hypothetical protein [Roseateles sp.]MBV8470953.1 hypothetical protein [Burkholderiaceae bacterium]